MTNNKLSRIALIYSSKGLPNFWSLGGKKEILRNHENIIIKSDF